MTKRKTTPEAVNVVLALVEKHRRAIEAWQDDEGRCNRYLKRMLAPLPLPRDIATAYDEWRVLVDFVNTDRSNPAFARDAAFWRGIRLEEVIRSRPARTWGDVRARLAWLQRDIAAGSNDHQPICIQTLYNDVGRLMRAT